MSTVDIFSDDTSYRLFLCKNCVIMNINEAYDETIK